MRKRQGKKSNIKIGQRGSCKKKRGRERRDKKAVGILEEEAKGKSQTQQAVNKGDTKREGVENGDRTLQAINEKDKKREKGSRKETGRPCALEEEAKEKSQTLQVVNEGDTKKGVVK